MSRGSERTDRASLAPEGREPRDTVVRGVFLFSDIEDSTVLWEQYPEAMAEAVAAHDRIISEAVTSAGGRVVKRVGDAMDAKFDDVGDAVAAAVAAQRELAAQWWGELGTLRVRMAVGAGPVTVREEGFFGPVLNQLGRILAAGHGGQVLLNEAAAEALDGAGGGAGDGAGDGDGVGMVGLGEFRFKGLTGAAEVFQLTADGLEERFPPLRVDHLGGVGAQRSGTVWGYELDAEVGAGRLGTVFRGSHPASGRDVAVRVVEPGLVNEPWFVRRFEAEARIVSRVDHVHLVGLRDFWRDPDGAYLVYPWFEGGSLADALDGRPWDLRRAGRLIGQVGSALVYLHDRGLVHGGVKPSNVLLDADGDAYLSDAWLPIRLLEGPSDGGGSEAADVRGLGLLVVAVLTGRWPSDPDRLPSVAELRSEVDAALDRAVAAAVSPPADGAQVAVRGLLEVVLEALGQGADVGSVRNPYKGLAAFGEADAVDFFGREDLLADLTSAVVEAPLVAVVGPSGSGKSSVVRAGLLPAVHRGELEGEWLVTDLMPGAEPFAELEAALLRVATQYPADLAGMLRSDAEGMVDAVEQVLPDDGRLLLVVDQFEELFSLVGDEGVRQAFLDGLVALADRAGERVRVVVTLRADFFDRPLGYPAFGALMKRGLVPVEALDPEGLQAAITGPAGNVGVEVESTLVAEIVSDLGEEPGRLPLVQFALTELFDRRDGDVLTLDAYRGTGGVVGALARRAEDVFDELRGPAKEAARQVFLRLVALGEGTEDTRRRVSRAELLALPGMEAEVGEVLDAFGAHRLLSFDRDTVTREPTVEVAHEALLRNWARLRGWIDEARDDLRQHRRLRQAATQWHEAGEDDAYLLAPERVEATDRWLTTAQVALSGHEQRFLDASRERRRELEAAEAERRAHEQELERSAVRRLRATVAVLAVGLVVAGALTAFALVQRDEAEDQRVAAEQQRIAAERAERLATGRGLAAASGAELENDPERSVLLGLEAVRATWDADGDVLAEAESALRQALLNSPVEQRLEAGSAMSVAPDGRIATLSVDGTLVVWDPETGETAFELEGQSPSLMVTLGEGGQETNLHRTEQIDFSPDGSAVVVADADLRGAIRVASTGEMLVELEGQLSRPLFSPDGDLVAAVHPQETDVPLDAGRTIGIWDAGSGELLRELHGDAGNVWAHDFSSDGSLLATATHTDHAHLWDVETGGMLWSVPTGGDVPRVHSVIFHPERETLVLGGADGRIFERAVEDGELIRTATVSDGWVTTLDLTGDGVQLLVGSAPHAVIWDLEADEEIASLRGHTANLSDVAFHPDGDRVVTSGEDDTTRIWRIDGGQEFAALSSVPANPAASQVGFTPDGRLLAVGELDGTVRVRELATMEEVLTLSHEHPVNAVAFGPGGETIATAIVVGAPDRPGDEWYGEVHLWNVATGDHLVQVAEHTHVVHALAFAPDESALISGAGLDLRSDDVASGEELFAYVHEPGPVVDAAFTTDGERIVLAGQDAALVLDATTGEIVDELVRQDTAVTSVAVVDDERVVLGDLAGRVRLWDLTTGEEVRTIRDEPLGVTIDVVDGMLAIASGDEVTVRDLETGERRFQIEHDDVAGVHLSPDGRYLVSPTTGGTAHVHVLDVDGLIGVAQDRLTRWWTDAECDEFLGRPCPDPPS